MESWCIDVTALPVVNTKTRSSVSSTKSSIFGQTTELTIEVEDPDAHPLHCSVPTHVAERNEIVVGADLGVSLKADMIHIMDSADPG